MNSSNAGNQKYSGGIDLNPYDIHVPKWVKAFAGTIATFILVPSIAFIAVVNLAGVEDTLNAGFEAYMKAQINQLNSSQQVVAELKALREQTAQWNALNEARMIKMEERLAQQEDKIKLFGNKLSNHLRHSAKR